MKYFLCIFLYFLSFNVFPSDFNWYNLLKEEKIDTIFKSGSEIVTISSSSILDNHNLKYGLKVIVFKSSKNLINFKVEPLTKEGNVVKMYKRISDSSVFVCNGGYFGYNNKGDYIPLGLVIHENIKLSNLMKWKSSRVLISRKYVKDIIKPDALNSFEFIKDAIQSYPILVENRENKIESDNKRFRNRTAVGFDAYGNFLSVIIVNHRREGVSLYELSEFLREKSKNGGLDMINAFAMDGGSSTACYIPKWDEFVGNELFNYVPNVLKIYLEKK